MELDDAILEDELTLIFVEELDDTLEDELTLIFVEELDAQYSV
jgi:hypothetical protein